MEETIIRVDDYSRLKELHKKIIALINQYDVTAYNAIGILETIKQEIFIENED